MSKYLRKFETSAAYTAAESTLDKPNVSYIVESNGVAFKPYVPPHNDIITYTASAKLAEVTGDWDSGLHTNAFSGTSGQLTITNHSFENGVGTIEFNGDVTSIDGYAFYYCTGLTSVTIPNSVTSIDGGAFSGCSGLTSITCNATTAPTIQSTTFRDVKTGGTLYVPTCYTGYSTWMGTRNYYLVKYGWTKVEQ